MPRPPRSRHAPTRSAQATTNAVPTTKQVSAPITVPNAPIIDNEDANENNNGENNMPRRTSSRTTSASMTRSRTSGVESLAQKMAMDQANQRRDAAMERLGNITSTTSGSDEVENEDEEIVKSTQEQDLAIDAKEDRVRATPVRPRLTDVSGLDLDDSMFDDLNTTMDTVAHASAQRSAETSTLSASRFRRRPRAGSFLSRDDGPIRPSSRTGMNTSAFSSTLNFGVFKRRAREPSILSTAQKPRAPRPDLEHEQDGIESNEDDEDEEPEEGNFDPEAESTPLRRSKRGSGRVEPAEESSSAKSRKRKSTENHEQRVRSSPYEVDDNVRQSIEQPQASEDESLLSSPPSLPSGRFSTPARESMDPELMAPPLSSDSSENNEELWPPLKAIPKARTRRAASALRQTPVIDDGISDMSSPPSLTHSPNYAASSSPAPARAAQPKRKPVALPPPKLTTAELTGMLPRRRRRISDDDPFALGEDESEDEVDGSGLRDGDDELAHLNTRAKRRPASRKTQTRAQAPSTKQSTDKSQHGSKKRVSRTYSRLSDKENQEDEAEEESEANPVAEDIIEEDSQLLVERIGEELKNAVRKFQEVDKWELSFEEKDRSSSPLNAR